jgi:hypothetical protein
MPEELCKTMQVEEESQRKACKCLYIECTQISALSDFQTLRPSSRVASRQQTRCRTRVDLTLAALHKKCRDAPQPHAPTPSARQSGGRPAGLQQLHGERHRSSQPILTRPSRLAGQHAPLPSTIVSPASTLQRGDRAAGQPII